MPERYQGMSLPEIHEDVGMGCIKFESPYGYRLRGVEMAATLT